MSSPSGLSGTTDTNGTFKYVTNDTVSLYIGGASGLKIASFSPSDKSQVFAANFSNYLSLGQLLLTLDSGSSAGYMDFTKIQSIPTLTLTALTDFLDSGNYDTAVLDAAKTSIQSANTSVTYKNSTTPTPHDSATELAKSSSTLNALPDNFLDAFTVKNIPYYSSSIVVSGAPTGERLNQFTMQYSKDSSMSISSDDTYMTYSPVLVTHPKSTVTNYQSLTATNTFTGATSTVSCPLNSTLISLTKSGSAISTSSLIDQNYTNTGSCQAKSIFQSLYPMDANFSTSNLIGKTLTVTQSCGASKNTITIVVDSNGNFHIGGNVCSIMQQGFYGANNYRNKTNPTVADGTIGAVSSFDGLVRFVPAGYNAIARSAFAPTMLLGRAIDNKTYYFSLSDGGTPGELAGGLLKFISLQ
jgi:hypothetical protein